jgi:ElaB/YqjD/DUF883 family membrane-anchored ribosome-binding protein
MNTNEIRERAEDVRASAEEATQSLKEKAAQWQQLTKDNAVRFAKRTDSYVHENVWSTMTLTAILAFTLGVLVARGRD